MSENITRRLDAWTVADRAAHQASKQLLNQRLAYIQGKGPKPSDAEVESVKKMRAEAMRLYRFAMDELEELSVHSAVTAPKT
jgi:hypothetical protein